MSYIDKQIESLKAQRRIVNAIEEKLKYLGDDGLNSVQAAIADRRGKDPEPYVKRTRAAAPTFEEEGGGDEQGEGAIDA